jgi:DNA-binding YbaB/EbfC family protein
MAKPLRRRRSKAITREHGGMADDPQQPVPDLGGLLGMAMEMGQQMAAAQEQAAANVVEGQSGGGAVRIEVTGAFEFRSVTISPDAVADGDVELLQDLVLAALRDAVEQVQELVAAGNPLAALGGGGMPDLGAAGGLGGLLGSLGQAPADEDDEDEDDEDEDDGAEDEDHGDTGP